jgi:hypothetical protein
MNVRRVLILSITVLAAGVAGYALLGLRAPKPLPPATSAPARASSGGTIIAVGPDGNLYAIQAPSTSGSGYGYGEREGRERYQGGFRHE